MICCLFFCNKKNINNLEGFFHECMHHGPSLSTNIVSVLMSQPVSRGLSDLSCACCQGSAGAWCDACAEALAPLLFPCVSVWTLDGAACHGTCTTRRNMHNSHNSSSNHKQVSRLQKWLLKRRNNDNVTSQISTVSLQFICRKGVPHVSLPLQQPRQHHLPQLPSSVVVPLVVETSSE